MTELLPSWFTTAVSVSFGLVVGSFVNVIVARVPQGESVVRPRSRCPGCGGAIAAYDNIPVLSWLLLRGRCRTCKTPISIRYPVIELLTGILFLVAKLRFGFSWVLFVRDWPFITMLVAIAFIDLEHRIIPDVLSLPGALLGLATAPLAALPGEEWTALFEALIGAGAGFGLFYSFAWLYHRFTGRHGLGGGDIKLLAMLGAFLGFRGVFSVILVSSVFGSLVGIGIGILNRGSGKGWMKLSIPFGPFLVVGGLYHYFLGDVEWFRFMIPT